MIAYIIRRLLYAIPILIGVNLITFALFFIVNPPDQMARLHLGERHVTQEAIDKYTCDDSASTRIWSFNAFSIFSVSIIKYFIQRYEFLTANSNREIGFRTKIILHKLPVQDQLHR